MLRTKYDWPGYGAFKELRIRHPLGLARTLKRIRHRLAPEKSQTLRYAGYRLDFPEVAFDYQVGARTYTNRIFFDSYSERDLRERDPRIIEAIFAHVGIALVPFLYILGDFRTVQADGLPLDEPATRFFEDILLRSLGEWHYCEGLSVTHPIRVASNNRAPLVPRAFAPEERALLLNGGGKDSAVAAELVTRLGIPFHWLTIDPNPTRRNIVQISGHPRAIELRVQFDPALRPYSSDTRPLPWLILFSFLSLLPAYLEKCRYVFVGNEYSANFGNTIEGGLEVNHQFCKSHEYEAAFGRYARDHIVTDVTYLSILRPLYELRIARLLANFPQYFGSFVSCNVGLDAGRWCKTCAKCAFAYLALAPFLPAEQLTRIFGEDLLDRNEIRTWIVDLTIGKMKPWDCVGTREECSLALALTLARYPGRDFRGWPRRKDLERCCQSVDLAGYRKEYLESFKEPHLMPESLARRLREVVDSLT